MPDPFIGLRITVQFTINYACPTVLSGPGLSLHYISSEPWCPSGWPIAVFQGMGLFEKEKMIEVNTTTSLHSIRGVTLLFHPLVPKWVHFWVAYEGNDLFIPSNTGCVGLIHSYQTYGALNPLHRHPKSVQPTTGWSFLHRYPHLVFCAPKISPIFPLKKIWQFKPLPQLNGP